MSAEIIKLKAEIERLKEELQIKEGALKELCAICREKNALITELCDALQGSPPLVTNDLMNKRNQLFQRAREATR